MLFTRYPEVGKTKTRLISYLGAEGAANLQRQMTERIVTTICSLRSQGGLAVEIHYSGGSLQEMQNWLGRVLVYKAQCAGDLGKRLQQTFAHGFEAQSERIVVIGSDCPEINTHHLEEAFRQLLSHDLVLGPAQDGGYYLVGLSKRCSDLFCEIAWGTERVFAQTLAIAQRLNLSLATLETLRDIDRPEDVQYFGHSP